MVMQRYLLWANLPGMLIAAILHEWLGGFGIGLAVILLILGFAVWVKLDLDGKD